MNGKWVRALFLGLLLAAGTAGGIYWNSTKPATFGDILNYAFISTHESTEVAVLHAETDKVVGKLYLPVQPDKLLVAFAPRRIVFSNREARSIYVYDLQTLAVEKTYLLDFDPETLLLSADGMKLAVADSVSGRLIVIWLYAETLQLSLEGLNSPANFTFDAEGSEIYLSDAAAREIKIIDIQTQSIERTVSIAGTGAIAAPSAVTRTTNGIYGYVVDAAANTVHIIDLARGTVRKILPTGNAPERAYGTNDGRYMLIANGGDKTVTVINVDYMTVEATLPGVADPSGIATGFFENLAYVFSASENRAVVIDLEKMAIAGEVPMQGSPGIPVADADGKKIYVPLVGSDRVALIDVHGMNVAKTFTRMPKPPATPVMARTNNYCH